MTTAVILAAGLGSRLLPFTENRPKALVEVAGRPLLAALLVACARAGCDDAIVVTGHLHEAVDRWLAGHAELLPVRSVYNEAYATRGNAWSLRVAEPHLHGRDFVKLDGDLVLDPAILGGLLAHPASSVLALDRRAVLDAETMKAQVDGSGRVTAIGKWLDAAGASGESIGIEKIGAADAPRVFAAIEALVEEMPGAYYEDAYQRLLAHDAWDLRAWDVGPARWTEIDTPADLAAAEELAGALGAAAGTPRSP